MRRAGAGGEGDTTVHEPEVMMSGWEVFVRAAADRFGGGDFGAVVEVATAGLGRFPECGDLFEIRGVARCGLGEVLAATSDLETASALVPLGVQGQVALADCYARLGKTDLARTILGFLAEPGRCPVPLLPDVARGLGHLGEHAAALGVCEAITAARPGYHPAWFGQAFYRLRLGEPLAAVAGALEAAYRLAPHAPTYRLNLARAWLEGGRVADAYGLVRDLAPGDVRCPCMARALARLAGASGDDRLAAGFLLRAAALERAGPRHECDSISPAPEYPR